MSLPIAVEVIGEAVQATNTAIWATIKDAVQAILPDVTGITYLHGHPVEIINTLAQRAKDNDDTSGLAYQRYPLVACFQDLSDDPIGQHVVEVNLQIIIAMMSEPGYTAAQRMEQVFKPILHPIYEELFVQVNKHKSVLSTYNFLPFKYDRLFWGTVPAGQLLAESKSTFSDYLDAVEVQNFKIRLIQNC